MPRFLTFRSFSVLLSVGLASAIALPTLAEMKHEHPSPAADASHGDGHGDSHSDHSHPGSIEVPAGQSVPTVTLTVEPDPVSGWNLHIQTENWAFAPEQVNQTSLPTEGHAHLYVNGEKVTRIYSQWYHLPSLPPGEHRLTVGLNANGHETLTHNGEPIEASVTVTVPPQ